MGYQHVDTSVGGRDCDQPSAASLAGFRLHDPLP
jgi:hypothetical protein